MKMKNKILNVLEFILEHILCAFLGHKSLRFSTYNYGNIKSCYRCKSYDCLCEVVHKPFKWRASITCDCGFTTSHTAILCDDAIEGVIDQWNHFHDEDYGTVSVYDDFS